MKLNQDKAIKDNSNKHRAIKNGSTKKMNIISYFHFSRVMSLLGLKGYHWLPQTALSDFLIALIKRKYWKSGKIIASTDNILKFFLIKEHKICIISNSLSKSSKKKIADKGSVLIHYHIQSKQRLNKLFTLQHYLPLHIWKNHWLKYKKKIVSTLKKGQSEQQAEQLDQYL